MLEEIMEDIRREQLMVAANSNKAGTLMERTKEELEESAREAYLRATKDEEAPTGFYTIAQWGKILGKPRTTLIPRLAGLVTAGKCEVTEVIRNGRRLKAYKIQ